MLNVQNSFCFVYLAFALKSEVDVGQRLIVSTVTATAVYCTAMPAPRVLEISRTIVSIY